MNSSVVKRQISAQSVNTMAQPVVARAKTSTLALSGLAYSMLQAPLLQATLLQVAMVSASHAALNLNFPTLPQSGNTIGAGGASSMLAAIPSENSFVLRDVRIEGLVRLMPAVAYGLLPMSSGDTVDDDKIADGVKKLYESGNFDDVKVSRQGNVLAYQVVERPMIMKVTFEGNKSLPDEALKKALRNAKIYEGDILKPAVLHQLQTEIEQQYALQGRYNAKLDVKQTPLPNNRVDVLFKFDEGKESKVVDINVIGNKAVSTEEIKRAFILKEKNWASFFSSKDVFAQEKLNASLEAVRSLYLNKGYLKFDISSSRPSLSADKKKVSIELSVKEGDQYKFSGNSFSGDIIFPENDLKQMITFKSGDMFSQSAVMQTNTMLNRKYSNSGYYFVEIKPIPEIDDAKKTVQVNYYINAGQQVYVRRISFVGNSTTSDKVMRQEMRQLEGSLASNDKIDLSKQRLERTGFFKGVTIDSERVPNTPDQIDLTVRVEEQQTGSTNVAVGYSQTGGTTFQFGISQANFMGTGKNVSLSLDRAQTYDSYNFSIDNPYFTIDGVSQSYGLYWRKTKIDPINVSNYYTDAYGGSLSFGYPLNEDQNVSAGISIDNTKVISDNSLSSVLVKNYLLNHGGRTSSLKDASGNELSHFEGDFLTYNLNLGWAYNTLNRPIFPTHGQKHSLMLDASLPGSDITYQRATLSSQLNIPLTQSENFVFRTYGKLGLGFDLPFWKNYFAGGVGTTRAFRSYSLGPRSLLIATDPNATATSSNSENVGGAAMTQVGMDLAFPLPFKGDWSKFRPAVFVEGAQVYDSIKNIQLNDMRFSAGIGFTWMTMIGPISWSYARPLNAKEGDEIKRVQFDIGRVF